MTESQEKIYNIIKEFINNNGYAPTVREIGKLANQSAESSHEIEEILKQLVANYDEIINRVRNENMKNELIKNKKLVFKILKKLTEEEKKELIEQPELIGESIWDMCKGVNEECLCNESKNDNESYCLENVGDNFSNCNNNGTQFHDRIEINSESIFE